MTSTTPTSSTPSTWTPTADHRQLQPRRRGLPVVRPHGEDLGQSPTRAPPTWAETVGFAITDGQACREASKMEIVRRLRQACVAAVCTGMGSEQVQRLEIIMKKAGVDRTSRRRRRAHARAGHRSARERHGHARRAPWSPARRALAWAPPAPLLMNALKHVTGVDMELRSSATPPSSPSPPEDALPGQQEPAPAPGRDAHGALHHLRHQRRGRLRAGGPGAAARLRRVLLGHHLRRRRAGSCAAWASTSAASPSSSAAPSSTRRRTRRQVSPAGSP